MTGLGVKGCTLHFIDKSIIISNNKSPGNGGGIYVDDNAALFSSVPVYLINNTATQYGGAIYSTANIVATIVNEFLCSFFMFDARFLNNYAKMSGNNIYGGYYYFLNKYLPHFNDILECNPDLVYLSNCLPKQTQSSISSTPLGACICINNSYIDCNQRVLYKEVYPGQTITLSLVTVGMCGGISPGLIVTKGTSVNLTLNEANQITDTHC